MAGAAQTRPEVVGVILAGGQSRRMGGTDKALLPLAGRPLIAHVIERLRPQVNAVVVNSNGDPARFADFGLEVIADAIGGFQGPLAGILTGMQWARRHARNAGWIATAAADTPFLPRDLVGRLHGGAAGDAKTIAVARSRDEVHHVFALIPVALAEELAAWLRTSNDRSVRAWLGRQGSVPVDFAGDPDPFLNINTPEDLTRAEAMVALLP